MNLLKLLGLFGKNGKEMPLKQIETMFAAMSKRGIDVSGTFLFSYFFADDDDRKLRIAADALQTKGFQLVHIYADEHSGYWMQLERTEAHTCKSLYRLNKELYKVAEEYKLASYDGFDIGNVDRGKPLYPTKVA